MSKSSKKWLISDELWAKIEPLLPARKPHPLGCHNPRVPDRDAMNAIGLSAVREVHRQHATPCQFAQSERAAEAATGLTTFRNCPLPKRLRLGLGAHFRHRPRLCPTPM